MEWTSDVSYSELGIEGFGFASVLVCTGCGCEANFYLDLGEEIQ